MRCFINETQPVCHMCCREDCILKYLYIGVGIGGAKEGHCPPPILGGGPDYATQITMKIFVLSHVLALPRKHVGHVALPSPQFCWTKLRLQPVLFGV